MTEPVLRVGIGGFGRSGRDIHAAWLRQDAERYRIVAVADALPPRRRDARREFNCEVFPDYRDLLHKAEIDLFVNALPSRLHRAGTVEAFRAGRHTVCEKPVGLNVKEFDAMTAAARKARRHLLPFQNSRFYPFFAKMREVIDSGVLGEILHIRTVWGGFSRRWDWQTLREEGGGNLLNTGPHPMDHAMVLFGPRQPRVFCRMRSIQPFGGTAEDFCAVTLYGKGAPTIEILLSAFLAYPQGDQYNLSATFGGMTGGIAGLRWKYFDPKKAPRHTLWKPWSRNRGFCSETLPWVEEAWTPSEEAVQNAFLFNSRAFYANVYDVLARRGQPVIRLAEVRRQIRAIETCHRQNPGSGRTHG